MLNAELEVLGRKDRHSEEWWRKFGTKTHRDAHVASYRHARAPLVAEVARLKAELDEMQKCHALEANAVNDLRSKLEAAQNELNHIRENFAAQVKAAERRQPVDRERARHLVKALVLQHCESDDLNAYGLDSLADKFVDAILGAAKAEPTAFVPAPTGDVPSDELLNHIVRWLGNVEKHGIVDGKNHWEPRQLARDMDKECVWSFQGIGTGIYRIIAADHAAQVKRVRELEESQDADAIEINTRDNEIGRLRAEVERLKAEASRPFPADGMSDRELGETIKAALYPSSQSFANLSDGGAKARELFGKASKDVTP